jgi:uncharacterized protein (DUF305 family)
MRLHATLATLLLCATPAFAQSMPGMQSGPDTPAARANADAMKKMDQAMMAPPSGDADRDFVTMMIPHHQGAIDMARIELQYGKDPTLRRLAQSIVAAQEKEIALMRKWQASHPSH